MDAHPNEMCCPSLTHTADHAQLFPKFTKFDFPRTIRKLTNALGRGSVCTWRNQLHLCSGYKEIKNCTLKDKHNVKDTVYTTFDSFHSLVHSLLQSGLSTERDLVLPLSISYINPFAYTDVPETAGLARSINP